MNRAVEESPCQSFPFYWSRHLPLAAILRGPNDTLCVREIAINNTAAPELRRAWDICPANHFKKTRNTTKNKSYLSTTPAGCCGVPGGGGGAGLSVKAAPPPAPEARPISGASALPRPHPPPPARCGAARAVAAPGRATAAAPPCGCWLPPCCCSVPCAQVGARRARPPAFLSPSLVVPTASTEAAAIAPRCIASRAVPALVPRRCPRRARRVQGKGWAAPRAREGEGRLAVAADGGRSRGQRGGAAAARLPAARWGDSPCSFPELPAVPAGSRRVCDRGSAVVDRHPLGRSGDTHKHARNTRCYPAPAAPHIVPGGGGGLLPSEVAGERRDSVPRALLLTSLCIHKLLRWSPSAQDLGLAAFPDL